MKRKYAYVFPMGDKVLWSSETEESLLKRVLSDEREKVQEFIDLAKPGYHLSLDTGDLVFQMA